VDLVAHRRSSRIGKGIHAYVADRHIGRLDRDGGEFVVVLQNEEMVFGVGQEIDLLVQRERTRKPPVHSAQCRGARRRAWVDRAEDGGGTACLHLKPAKGREIGVRDGRIVAERGWPEIGEGVGE
jgi:hypothetical protein